MKVIPIPVNSDNYAYLLIDPKSKKAAAVDPAEASKVISKAEEEGVKIETVLTTHYHGDHSGGNQAMHKHDSSINIVGGEDVPAMSQKVHNGDHLKVGDIDVQVFAAPCHTKGHVLYYATHQDDAPAIFTGDTLFIAGCGKFFEGDAKQMHHNLIETIGSLPKETQVYVGHEYTVKNLQFALSIEPENKAAQEKLEWAKKQVEKKQPTVPSTVQEEFSFNPFMRVGEESVQKAVGKTDPIEVMHELREKKNHF